MFKVAPKKVYRGMRDGSQQKVKNMPEQTEVESFWKSIWNVPTQHDTEAPWLANLKQEYCKNVKAKDYEITDEVLDKVLSKLANDKPGRDLIPGLWIKRLSSMKEHFKRNLINSFNLDKEIPQWLVLSKTLLLPKIEDTNKANNYRPTALQNSMHKVFIAIITEFIMDHCTVNNIVTEEQAAGKLGSWGCVDQLLINKMVSDEVIKNRRNLITVWLDYKKAFDSVPHSWIIESLKLTKIPDKIIDAIKMVMFKWRTKIHLYGETESIETSEIEYYKGKLQGDMLSLILFVLSVNPLSFILHKKEGYKIGKEKTSTQNRDEDYKMEEQEISTNLSHLFFVDDLKLYAVTLEIMKALLEIVT